MSNYTESKLVTVALGVIKQNPGITTSDLKEKIIDILEADGNDLQNNPSRSDSKISQKIRNMKSHDILEKEGARYDSTTGTWWL